MDQDFLNDDPSCVCYWIMCAGRVCQIQSPAYCVKRRVDQPTSLAHGTLHLLTTAFSRLPGPLTPELVYIQVISINQRVIWEIVPMWCSSILKATAVPGIGRNAGAPLLTGCSRNQYKAGLLRHGSSLMEPIIIPISINCLTILNCYFTIITV